MGAPQSPVPSRPAPSPCRKTLRALLGVLAVFSAAVILYRGITAPLHASRPLGATAREPLHCRDTPLAQARSEAITFGADRTLSVRQTADTGGPRGGYVPQVFGSITVQPAAEGAVTVRVSTSADVAVAIAFDAATQALTVTTPEWVDDAHVCIGLAVAVSVPPGAQLHSLLLDAVHLGVRIQDGLALLSQSAVVSTVVADVVAGGDYALASRIAVETASGGVRGWFPLRDSLRIRTASGDVGVDVTPQPVSGEAVLDVSSASGALVVREAGDAPPRRYVVRMSTLSGDVDARVAFSEARFASQSGDVRLRLLPVQSGGAAALETSSKSGETEVELLAPASGSLALRSRHGSVSGSVGVAYPRAWEGSFSMSTMSGRQSVRGEGVEYRRRGGFASRRIEGSRGDGESVMTMETVTGSERLVVGVE